MANLETQASPFEILLGSDTRFKIWIQLNLYGELKLSQIAENLQKSKSTIHEHIQKLLKAGLLQISQEKQSRGWIPAKFYQLAPDWKEKFYNSPEIKDIEGQTELQENLKHINRQKVITRMNMNILELKMQFHDLFEQKLLSENQEDRDKYLKKYTEMRYSQKREKLGKLTSDIVDFFGFYEDSKYYKFMYDVLTIEFDSKEEPPQQKERSANNEKSFYVMLTGIPLKKMLDLLK